MNYSARDLLYKQLVRNQYANPFQGCLSSGLGQIQQQAGSLSQQMRGLAGSQHSLGALGCQKSASALHRYDPAIDELVPATQEWIDETSRALCRIAEELKQARADIAALSALLPNSQPAAESAKADYMWRCLVAACG